MPRLPDPPSSPISRQKGTVMTSPSASTPRSAPRLAPRSANRLTPGLDSARAFAKGISGFCTMSAVTDQTCPAPTIHDGVDAHENNVCALMEKVETRLVEATWTLRRLPDRERGFLTMRGMIWPDAPTHAGDYGPQPMSAMQARRAARIDPKEIDRMQPALDLLQLLPDIGDRQLLFWAAWHQDGQKQAKLPWVKVRRCLQTDQSRWTLKRRYGNGLKWLASIILAQA